MDRLLVFYAILTIEKSWQIAIEAPGINALGAI
jgi:hypothetical protein